MGPYMTSIEYSAACFGFFPLNWTIINNLTFRNNFLTYNSKQMNYYEFPTSSWILFFPLKK